MSHTQITIQHYYSCSESGEVTLPEGKTTDDIESLYVKWGTAHITFKDGTSIEEDVCQSGLSDSVDWKRPNDVEVYAYNEDEGTDYNEDLSELAE